MNVLFALMKKEFLLIARDRWALAALFVLPSIFILIMSLALQNAAGDDKAALTYAFGGPEDATTAELGKILSENGGVARVSPADEPQFNLTLKDGAEHVTVAVDYRVDGMALALFRSQLALALMRLKLHSLQERFGVAIPAATAEVTYTYAAARAIRPSATQQSVPSWIIFAMFFIIISLSNVFIAERKQNTLARLRSMDIGFALLMAGKIPPYYLLNQLQTLVMLATGMYLTPLCGGQALTMNGSFLALWLISSAISCAAVGTAFLIASLADTAEQAGTVGGVVNVLFGALGGVMVPKYIMPDYLRQLTVVSPMSWGLDGFLKIFAGGAAARAVALESVALFSFGAAMLALAIVVSKKRGTKS
ncbi:MAG: ABC transporter permease [Desulfobulbaceae bacterium]|jgi:ABC-2 type transport system permease protein|nr:ABC transporter permease [Desulfobulbaceae bacterium]